ncbi:glycosyltransferase family 4 protein [Dietzia sp. E1]|uniref:glycosyltransferase family 4 protein n=1 Tax=Dietzia sp. E1 TaxID=328361 RepID=UPI001F50D952|nr:glycosyltransferase family 4 protein [Dietzia sp. E1]
MAKGLASLGHEIHVVTGFPNYPHGEIYPGYKVRPYMRELLDGVTIHRGPLYPSHDGNPVRRISNYLSFSAGAIPTSFRVPTPDVWLTNCTPATVAAPAMLQNAVRQTPHAQIIQDLWPDSFTGSGFVTGRTSWAMSAAISRFCQLSYRLSDSIGVISPKMIDLLSARGVPRNKLSYVPNSIDDSHLHPSARCDESLKRKLRLPSGRIFMYAGNFGKLQSLPSLISAFTKTPDAQLVLVGGGVEEELMRQRAVGAPNIHFVPRQPLDKIGEYIAASDVQIVSLADTPLLRVTMPSKVQAALAAGRPIFAHAMGDAADVVTDSQVGIAANSADQAETVAAIQKLLTLSSQELSEMGSRARKLYEDEYSLKAGALRLESFLEATIKSRSTRPHHDH